MNDHHKQSWDDIVEACRQSEIELSDQHRDAILEADRQLKHVQSIIQFIHRQAKLSHALPGYTKASLESILTMTQQHV